MQSTKMNRSILVVAGTCVLMTLGAPSFGNEPFFTGLGDLPGGDFSSKANAISADGTVVVGVSKSLIGSEAFRWTLSGGMSGLGDLSGGGTESEAHGVSADGSVIVGRGTSASGGEAFYWSQTGGMMGLGDLAGGSFDSVAYDVSANGLIVVGAGNSDQGTEAYWCAPHMIPMQGLGDLPGGGFCSEARGVSADGTVIVGTGTTGPSEDDWGPECGFRWTQGTGMEALDGSSYGDYFTWANDVSADGSVIAGGGAIGAGIGASAAVRWTDGTGGLDSLPDYIDEESWGYANGLSSDGSVIIGMQEPEFGVFIWDAEDGMRSLRDLLVAGLGLDLNGWSLSEATGISSDGLTIVGYGTNPDGQQEGWIARVPEPGTLCLLALGSLLIGRRRRS